MFVDSLTIEASAGRGGDGVERWLREQHRPLGGPAGGDGGRGGDVYVRAVRNINQLAKYTGEKRFRAEDGEHGHGRSRHGKAGADLVIDVPVGSTVTCTDLDRTVELNTEGETVRVLRGGKGGLGNERFKSSVNRTPTETTEGRPGERSVLVIELALVVDVGIIGLPNAGKSTLLNALTNAHSRVGAYPFTTLEPHLGDLHGCILADIPGLISGAAQGKGLGHKFLRHISKAKMLLHCISLENTDVREAYETVHAELAAFDSILATRPEIIVLTKTDVVAEDAVARAEQALAGTGSTILHTSSIDEVSIKSLSDTLTARVRAEAGEASAS